MEQVTDASLRYAPVLSATIRLGRKSLPGPPLAYYKNLEFTDKKCFILFDQESVFLWLQTAAYTQDSKGHLVSVAADTF